jgi:uncharacterized protein YkwD
MIAPTLLTIGRLLLLGLTSVSPVGVTPTLSPVAVNAQAPSAVAATITAIRDYSSLSGSSLAQGTDEPQAVESAEMLTSEEAALFEQTNLDREASGLSDLELDPLLCTVARGHSEDMSQRNYFDHFAPSPGPISPMDRYLDALGAKPVYAFLGENIYYRSETESTDVSANEANQAFMHSPGHRANILQPKFTKIGIGYYRDASTGAFWVTEMFLADRP